MKKLISLLLVALMVFSFAACGSGDDKQTANITDATELLTTVWGKYAEEDKFAIAGGDFNNSVMGEAGKFDHTDADNLDYILGVPASAATLIDDAASIMHMMNQNTFTCGAFHITDAGEISDFAESIKDNILNREWMCGFPDTLIVASVGQYVVSAFGNAEIMETFKTNLSAAYDVEIIYEESLAF